MKDVYKLNKYDVAANLRVYVHIYIYHIDGTLPPRNNASKTMSPKTKLIGAIRLPSGK